MLERMNWEAVYRLWKRGACFFPQSLASPLTYEKVFVDYKGTGCFYGYDWLENTAAAQRKELIQTNMADFLYFTKPTNKGTVQTVEMLLEAVDEEERAAVWIAATAFELQRQHEGHGVYPIASQMHNAAGGFLQERFYPWHHAMKRLVPDILIPHHVLNCIPTADAETVMLLIQMNTLMLKGSHSILLYSSLKDDAAPVQHSVRLPAGSP